MSGGGGSAGDLRAAFDRVFAEPPPGRPERPEPFLHIGVAGQPYLVALAEVAGVHAGCTIAPLPSTAHELLGLAGIRGEPVPVFGLAALLGGAAGAEDQRWIVLAAGPVPLGFAFDMLEGYRGIAPGDIVAGDGGQEPWLGGTAAMAGAGRCPILRLAVLAEMLAARADRANRERER
ncbi:chemotaxis protein CheW [Sphingomonas canadensis]|uniref:Chemotaxis protein CheW n=1 Tax=Sphingomonas canadensis TaxID=1219257 RepID=A0ABW3H7S6_9SPHN|nr:chemotaxis protein CheW [Sphingomonas canadensis]MCW3834736.1 chemotaxis protein CheW [Sphingomonas canadensis]